ncbi:MAG: acyltransferase [Erythrobacter sp.]
MTAPPLRSPDFAAERFEVLDALRGLCALLVALYHFQANGLIARSLLVQNGWLFVDYFFVLSGFVIAHSYGERLREGAVSVGRFMALRMGRIYPLHIAVLLAFVALELLLVFGGNWIAQFVTREPFTGSRSIGALVQNIFLLQSFGIEGGRGWNGPAWSIAAEMWTYLLFALIFVAARRWFVWIAALIVVVAAAWLNANAPDLHVTFEGGIVRCIFGFSVGVLTYQAYRRFGGLRGQMWEVLAIGLVIAFASFATGRWTFLAPLIFALTIMALATQSGVISAMLRRPFFQLLGLISYSIYMIHVFLQGRLGEVLQMSDVIDISVDAQGRTLLTGSPWVGDAVTLAMLALLIAVSWLGYRLVEKPGRDWSRRLLA